MVDGGGGDKLKFTRDRERKKSTHFLRHLKGQWRSIMYLKANTLF